MTELLGKAKNLAEDLLLTEPGKQYSEARTTFEVNPEAMEILQSYGEKVQAFQAKSQSCEDEAELQADQAELTELVTVMQQNPIIANFFQAEEQFHRFVAQVMDVFNATLIGQPMSSGGCGCGSEGGCCGGENHSEEEGCGCNGGC